MDSTPGAATGTPEAAAVLLTGVYGVGKTTVAEELAARFAEAGRSYGAIDLDWLRWFDVPDLGPDEARRVHLGNVASVAGRYVRAGVTRLVLAGSVRSVAEVEELRAVVPVDLRVVQLCVPIDVIRQRLSSAPTHERRVDDVRTAARWLEDEIGGGVGDVVIDADRPLDAVTDDVAAWLGWT